MVNLPLTPPSSSSSNDSNDTPGTTTSSSSISSSSSSCSSSSSSSSCSSSLSSSSSASSYSFCLPASSSSHGKTDSDVTSGCGAAHSDLPHQKSVRIKRKLNKPSRRCSEHAVNEFRYHRIGGTATIKREEAEVVGRPEVVGRQEVVGRPEVQLGSVSQHVRRPEKKLLVSIPLKDNFPLLDHIKKEPDDQTYRKSRDIHFARNGSFSLNHNLEVKKEPPESTGQFVCMFGRYSDSGHESDSDATPRLLIRRDQNIYVSDTDWQLHWLTVTLSDSDTEWQRLGVTAALSDSDTEWQWHWVTLILIDSDTDWQWHWVTVTLPDSDTDRQWHWLTVTLSDSDTDRQWHWQTVTLTDIDTDWQ